jgi:hypothetical protein
MADLILVNSKFTAALLQRLSGAYMLKELSLGFCIQLSPFRTMSMCMHTAASKTTDHP